MYPFPLSAPPLQVGAVAGVRLKLFKYGVTNKQDIKVSLGMDVASGGAGQQGGLTTVWGGGAWGRDMGCGVWGARTSVCPPPPPPTHT